MYTDRSTEARLEAVGVHRQDAVGVHRQDREARPEAVGVHRQDNPLAIYRTLDL